MSNILLVDCCSDSELCINLNESAGNGRVKFRGKFQEADAENKNKRVYPYDILDENVDKLQEAIKDRRLVGELDHPTDSIIHFKEASHIVTKLWWEGKILMGEGEILNTPHGKILKALIEDGVRIGMSSRGVGNGKVNEDGVFVIGEGYKLITFDAVADPSTYAAFQEKVVSRKRENNLNFENKNESRNINKIKKSTDALVACLTCFVESKTEEYKSRLKNGK